MLTVFSRVGRHLDEVVEGGPALREVLLPQLEKQVHKRAEDCEFTLFGNLEGGSEKTCFL